eukprot:gene9899-10057_t
MARDVGQGHWGTNCVVPCAAWQLLLLTVYVGGMPYSYSREQLAEYWSWCGTIETLDMLTFPDSGRFRGIAFITFETQEGADAALACNGEQLEGQTLKASGKSKGYAHVHFATEEGLEKALGLTGSELQGRCVKAVRLLKNKEDVRVEAFSVLEQCRFPVIAAVQGACVGAGVDLITAADLRYCCLDAYFTVKEVDVAITADLGTLQRLPGIIGHGAACDLALTARQVNGTEAASLGLVSRCYDSRSDMDEAVWKLAADLAAKSPLAVAGTKRVLLHTRDHPGVSDGLAHVALWNSAYLLSADMEELIRARSSKRAPAFSKM